MICKIVITKGLRPNSSKQRVYGVAIEKALLLRGLVRSLVHYSGWRGTDTPRECAGLARVFAVQGLDNYLAGYNFAERRLVSVRGPSVHVYLPSVDAARSDGCLFDCPFSWPFPCRVKRYFIVWTNLRSRVNRYVSA